MPLLLSVLDVLIILTALAAAALWYRAGRQRGSELLALTDSTRPISTASSRRSIGKDAATGRAGRRLP